MCGYVCPRTNFAQRNQVPKGLINWTWQNWQQPFKRSLTSFRKSWHNGLGSVRVPSITPANDCKSLEKKTLGYAERCPQKRRQFLRLRERYRRRGYEFIFVDESGFEPDAYRCYGYARRGVRLHGLRSGQRRPRTNLLACRHKGRLRAPWLFEGACNTALFNQWLEQELCPVLGEGTVVVMDNAVFHKSKRTRELIEATGAILLYLPPYSPDLNPIEHSFGTMKRRRSNAPHLSLDELVASFC